MPIEAVRIRPRERVVFVIEIMPTVRCIIAARLLDHAIHSDAQEDDASDTEDQDIDEEMGRPAITAEQEDVVQGYNNTKEGLKSER